MTGSDHYLVALANQYGTPLFAYDGPAIAQALRDLSAALHPAMEVLYPLSVNPNISIVGLLGGNGAAAGVSSLVELRTATMAGVCPSRMIFLGPGQSRADLDACVAAGVYAMVVGSREELAELAEIAGARSVRQRVLLGIDLRSRDRDVEPGRDGGIRELGIDEAHALATEASAGRYPTLDIAGVHGYHGPRVLDPETVLANTARILDAAAGIAATTGIQLDAVSVGSGLAVAHFDGESDPDLKTLAAGMDRLVEEFHSSYRQARLLFDAGAFLTARGTTYIARVRYVRESTGHKLAVIDGATPHLIADNASHSANGNVPTRLLNRPVDEPVDSWRIAGPLGTLTDASLVHVALPRLRPGDLLGFERCGMDSIAASHELLGGHGFPAEVLVDGDESYLIRSRDEPADVLRKQRAHHLRTVHLDRTQLIEQIRVVTALRLGREAPVINEETELAALGLAGAGALELLMDLEQQAHFEVDADQLDPGVFRTVGSLIDYIMAQRRRPAR